LAFSPIESRDAIGTVLALIFGVPATADTFAGIHDELLNLLRRTVTLVMGDTKGICGGAFFVRAS
jgi:hypothetical protein